MRASEDYNRTRTEKFLVFSVSKLEEASTHKSATTHVALFFVPHDLDLWCSDSKINGYAGLMVENFYVKPGDTSCISFWDVVQINRQTYKRRLKPYPHNCRRRGQQTSQLHESNKSTYCLQCTTAHPPTGVSDINDSVTHLMVFDRLLPFRASSQAVHYVVAESAARTLSQQLWTFLRELCTTAQNATCRTSRSVKNA